MTLKEVIDIGRVLGATTIGEADAIAAKLCHELGLISGEDWESYCDEYASWRAAYEETFGGNFEDCKI